jgi:predicted protein tyrosine phosphatase
MVAGRRRPSHLISLLDPGQKARTPKGVDRKNHLRLDVHDISDDAPGRTAPDAALVERLLAFGRQWDATTPLLIHCHAGISRSTAAALVLLCARNPQANESTIANEFRKQSRYAQPNRRIVALADAALHREGRLIAAVEAIGRGAPAAEGQPFEVRARWS